MRKNIAKISKPIVPWMGGKSKLAKTILSYFPQHTCYVEPFAGGAAILFAKDRSKCEVINDQNGELMNLYRVIQHHLEAFLDHFQWILSSREHFVRLKDADPKQLTDVQRAVRFFYLQKHAFGGHVYRQYFGTSAISPPRFNSHEMIKRLQDGCKRLKRVYIEHDFWEKVIDRYDRNKTLIYCDPPYWETTGYGVPFPWAEYEKLKAYMENVKGMMIVSINDHPAIRILFEGFKSIPLSTTYTVGKKRLLARELLIFNKAAEREMSVAA